MAAKRKKRSTARKKKTSTTRRVTNKTELAIKLEKGLAVDGGPDHLYHVHLKGKNKGSVTAGSVLAKSETEAKTKARRLLRTLVG